MKIGAHMDKFLLLAQSANALTSEMKTHLNLAIKLDEPYINRCALEQFDRFEMSSERYFSPK